MKNKKKPQNRYREYFRWTLVLFFFSFFLSAILNYISSYVSEKLPVSVSFILLICIILLGILFDIIGIATAAADEVPFHAMAAKKVKGAKVSVWLIKNASKVSSICNDVIGDICGILSGVLSASIIFYIAKNSKVDPLLPSIFLTAMVAAVTISGKSIGKYFAIKKSNEIVRISGKILGLFLKM